MKETERMKKIKEELSLLERRMKRLSTQIREGVNEIVIRQELRLVQEALNEWAVSIEEAYYNK